jgi:hypothetical protein
MEPACHPIIHVRGHAMAEGERNETAAEPSCRKPEEGKVQVQIRFDRGGKPGISGKISAWNA